MLGSIVELLLIILENVLEYPPVRIILKLQSKEVLIFFIMLFINPWYPHRKPALRASFVFFPKVFELVFKLNMGKAAVNLFKFIIESLTPGAMTPPS